MKFAKLFQQVLTDEGIPEEWKERAIQYKKLKKRINKVVEEFEKIGISKDDVKFNYDIELSCCEIHPHLKINISPFQRELIVDKLEELEYDYEIIPLKVKEIEEGEEDDVMLMLIKLVMNYLSLHYL